MTTALISLAIIALVAAVVPLLAQLIPGRAIPETVFLLAAGAVLGPNLLNVIVISEPVSLLSNLGLALLFLLAGYEINPKDLTGRQGRQGGLTWLITLAIAFAATWLLGVFKVSYIDGIAVAIALTTTALGALMPILQERELMDTKLGRTVLAFGSFGELGPIIAMALLMSSRSGWQTLLVLLAFAAVAVLTAGFSKQVRKVGGALTRFLDKNVDTTAQSGMRMAMLLLIGLVTLSAVFDLDIILGAFAAGFVLRFVIPEGSRNLEHKLEGVAYGFMIPIFFVVSGAQINLAAVGAQPLMLIVFILLLLLIRAVPVFISLYIGSTTRPLPAAHKLTVALYCTTALPMIVAVTGVAVESGAMSPDTASVLVAAGAITMFLMPFLASLTYRVVEAEPVQAVRQIRRDPRDVLRILREHAALAALSSKADVRERALSFARRLPTPEQMAEWKEVAEHIRALRAAGVRPGPGAQALAEFRSQANQARQARKEDRQVRHRSPRHRKNGRGKPKKR
jgi:Kef-type K+ transport system membrane component KefB